MSSLSKIPVSFIPSLAVHAAASARGLIFFILSITLSGHGISDGALKVASFGSLVCGTSQRPVRLFRQSRNPLATAGRTRMTRGKTLPENRSDLIKAQPFPSGCDDGCPPSPCQFSHTCLRGCGRRTSRTARSPGPFSARLSPASTFRVLARWLPYDPSAHLFGVNGADAASSCVPPDFRFYLHDRVRP